VFQPKRLLPGAVRQWVRDALGKVGYEIRPKPSDDRGWPTDDRTIWLYDTYTGMTAPTAEYWPPTTRPYS
jgi:hypothetical protein